MGTVSLGLNYSYHDIIAFYDGISKHVLSHGWAMRALFRGRIQGDISIVMFELEGVARGLCTFKFIMVSVMVNI